MAKAEATAKVTSTDAKRKINGVLFAKVDREYLLKSLKKTGVEVGGDETTEALVGIASNAWGKLPETEIGKCDVCEGVSPASLPKCGFCADAEPDAKPKATKATLTKTEPTTGIVKAPAPKDDLVPSSQIQTERELDEAVGEVLRLKSATAASHWDLGSEIGKIYTLKLWELRRDKDNKPRYRTWEAFVAQELMMSHTNARSLMDVAKEFPRDRVAALGAKKLGLILTLPPEDQPRLLAAAEGGASKREIEKEVRRVKKEKEFRRPNRESPNEQKGGRGAKAQAGTTAKGSTGRKADPLKEKITVASMLGTTTLKAYQRPASLRNLDVETLKRAKKMSDIPFSIEHLENNVVQIITLGENAVGEWQFKVERKRVAE